MGVVIRSLKCGRCPNSFTVEGERVVPHVPICPRCAKELNQFIKHNERKRRYGKV
jgi:hypothetical protein